MQLGKVCILEPLIILRLLGFTGINGCLAPQNQIFRRDLRHGFSSMLDAQELVIRHFAHRCGFQAPFIKDRLHFIIILRLHDHQHSFLGFRQHYLIGCHPLVSLGYQGCIHLDANFSLASHFGAGTGEPGSAHILDSHHQAGVDYLQSGFHQ